jgi:membrane-bound lytic murein transglycosylase B
MPGAIGRRRTTVAGRAAATVALVAGALLASVPSWAAPDQEPPVIAPADGEAVDLAATRPVDTPGIDPVLDGVEVRDSPAIRRAEEALTAVAGRQSEATLRWIDAERKRNELAQRAASAGQLAAAAQAKHDTAKLDLAVKEDRLAERRRIEAGYLETLEERQDELRELAATLFATAPEDRYTVLGSLDDITAADRRDALRDRGSDLQIDRVAEARRPWSKAHEARLVTQGQVARARVATAAAGATAAEAIDERDRSDELLRAADAAVATALGDRLEAEADTQRVLAERRTARLDSTVAAFDVPLVALHAYWRAAELAPCKIPWWVIAGIGRVESGHGSAQGSALTPEGDTTVRILGIPLDGRPGVATIGDSDGGRLDGDTTFDRAVGPMQFIPGTWNRWAADGNADDEPDPHNIYDAAGAAARYLCFSRGDLLTEPAIRGALLAYNRSVPYGTKVLAEGGRYRDALDLPDIPETRDPDAPTDAGN